MLIAFKKKKKRMKRKEEKKKKGQKKFCFKQKVAPTRIRTADLIITSDALYP